MDAPRSPAADSLDHLPRIGQFLPEIDRLGRAGFLARYGAPVLLFASSALPRARGGFATEHADALAIDGALAKTAVAWVAKRPGAELPGCVWLGRDPRYDVCLPFAGISKLHAGLFRGEGGAWAVTDAGSRNGTTVNGVAVAPRASIALSDGDRLRFASLEALFFTAAGFLDEVHRIRRVVEALRTTL